MILDGWGQKKTDRDNAIAAAHTPVWDDLWQNYPHTTLSASGLDVGLPDAQMGNSEVGHLTIGAGRILPQDLTRISTAIQAGALTQHAALINALENTKTLHILGLLSPGGVHSHEEHMHALIHLAAEKKIKSICIHAFLDGRDTAPKSAKFSLEKLEQLCQALPNVHITSLCGRYYAMDRDKRWDRTQKTYELLTEGKTPYHYSTASKALEAAYQRGETDEFVAPTSLYPACISDDDLVVFMNFRTDRTRQLSFALSDPNFTEFKRNIFPKVSQFFTLTQYTSNLNAIPIFPPPSPKNLLGDFLAAQHLLQLRIAETEKYAHVTFFFNGGKEAPVPGEDRILIPSKKVATYDLCPEMSAQELTDALIQALKKPYAVIIGNYANADMVGHTGHFDAAVKAIETLDACLGQLVKAVQSVGGELLITADHGNAETMFDQTTQQPCTSHTLERVPFVYIGRPAKITHHTGTLADVAPTLLKLLDLKAPTEMTGQPLLKLS